MPILAVGPVATPPTVPSTDLRDSRSLTFRDLSGVEPFVFRRDEFFFQPGLEGIGRTPQEAVRDSQPGMDGTRLREIRYREREVFLPLFLRADTHTEYMRRRDLLDDLLSHEGIDYTTEDGTFDLVAKSIRGERSLRCAYVEGLEGGLWPDEGATYRSLGIRAIACRPHWNGGYWSTPVIRQPEPARWFGTFPGGLTSSRALGSDILVTVPGDVRSWPTVQITGPATAVTITSSTGLSVSLPAGVSSGEFFELVTDPRRRGATFNGVKDWTRISPTDRYGQGLPPGDQYLNIVVTGATGATNARVIGDINWKNPW